jgi:hypothetical protein
MLDRPLFERAGYAGGFQERLQGLPVLFEDAPRPFPRLRLLSYFSRGGNDALFLFFLMG